jgi:hypothetical protein
MKITFSKNVQFTKLIKVKGRLKEFNFRKSNISTKGTFTVDVLDHQDTQGNRIIFHMEMSDNKWQIVPQQLPGWVMEKENEFDGFIREELGGSEV